MGDSSDRLRQAREKAGFPSARAAAIRFGWKESTYASHENGQTPVPAREAPKYAKAFKVSPGWILTGEGSRELRNFVRVMGRIGAGAEISPDEEQVPPEGIDEIEVPFPLPDNAIAFEVQGESMWPRYDPGDVIVCINQERDPGTLIGQEAAIKTVAGQRYLKRLDNGARRGTFDLLSFNAEAIRNVRIAWASEVHSVVRASKWKSLKKSDKSK